MSNAMERGFSVYRPGDWINRLADKGKVYWLSVVMTVTTGLYIGHRISDARMWMESRYVASGFLQRFTSRVPIVKYTTIVTIGTPEYWEAGLSARVPINRRYLGKLLNKIAGGDPFLIALDFDMRSPRPDGSEVEFSEFTAESLSLIEEIGRTAAKHHVVLPRTIWDAPQHRYRLDSDIWNLQGDVLQLPNVHGGYISLPPDLRQVPLAVPLVNAEPLDSFALAIARARAENVTDLLNEAGGREHLPFASFIPEREFPTHTAREVLDADAASLKRWFDGRLVMIGGDWNTLAAGRGPRVDLYLTPAGVMPGVFIHANFVEALLDQRTFEPAPEWVVAALEIMLVLVCIVVLALDLNAAAKIGTWMMALIVLVTANYVALQNLGRFFDFFVPMMVLAGHVAIEQVNEWRKESREHRARRRMTADVLAISLSAGLVLSGTGAYAQERHEPRPASGRLGQATPGIEDMGTDPIVREGVDSVDSRKAGGARRGPTPGRSVDSMGHDSPLREEVAPNNPGGPKRGPTPLAHREIDSMGPDPVVRDGVESVDTGRVAGPRHDGSPAGNSLNR